MLCSLIYNIFFFKQKTAYEMRISDWSSDVCSSDLAMIDLMHDRRFTQLVIECGTYESDGIGHTALMDDHFQHLRGETSGREFDRAIGRASCRERVCQYV